MNKLILDKDYSDALICAMYESKKIKYEPQNEHDNIMFENILRKYARKGIKKKALEYALLYDGLELISPCIISGNELIIGVHNPDMDEFDMENFQHAIDVRDFSLTTISNYRDNLSCEEEWFTRYRQIKKTNRKLVRGLSHCFYNAACLFLAGKIEEAFHQIPNDLKMGLSNDECIIRFAEELSVGECSALSATLFLYMMWIEDITYMMKLSVNEEVPFITNRIDFSKTWKVQSHEAKSIVDVYEKCTVLMKQELLYMPNVETYDDVLKLREKKELIRFKEMLNYWVGLLSKNEIDLANKMREDIIKANKELKRYCEYENKATTFFFWFSLVTSFIPVVPGVVWWGVENATKKAISTQIEKHGWVGIGKI